MKYWLVLIVLLATFWLAGCGSEAEPAFPAETSAVQPVLAVQPEPPISFVLEGPLALHAFNKDRTVSPDSDENFEFAIANNTEAEMAVVVVLEHRDGVRWPTSLCVELQCLLGDGSDASVSDPIVLPPYFQQPFQVHAFVNAEAAAGQSETLSLRVEPQTPGLAPQVLTLSASVRPK